VQDRGLAAYIAELIGTLFLVFVIGMVISLFVSTGAAATVGSDFAVVALAQGLVLFLLIIAFGQVSGGHFNPAVTVAAAVMRRIDPIDAVVYILAQLSGGVLGALIVKGLIEDEGRATSYGAATISDLLGGSFAAAVCEGIGAFFIVLAVVAVAMNPRARQEWAPYAIGLALTVGVFIFGPLTGAALNPARWFGPALIGDAFGSFSDIWPYIFGPLVGALVAVGVYRFVIAGPQYAEGPEPPTTAARGVGQAVKDAEVRARNR
jgi:glycerol uptake facilitator protein